MASSLKIEDTKLAGIRDEKSISRPFVANNLSGLYEEIHIIKSPERGKHQVGSKVLCPEHMFPSCVCSVNKTLSRGLK